MTFNFGSMALGLIVGIAVGMAIEYFTWIDRLKKRNLFNEDGSLKENKKK